MALVRDRIILSAADVVTAASTNYAPVTGLNFNVQGGACYHFRAVCLYTVAATTTGVRFGLSASPTTAPTLLGAMGYAPNGIGTIDGGGHDNFVTTANTTGGYAPPTDSPDTTGGNIHIIEGIIVPSVTAVLQLEVGPEAAAAVTVCKGTYLEWELLCAAP